FTPPQHAVDLRDWSQWWDFKFGANWRRVKFGQVVRSDFRRREKETRLDAPVSQPDPEVFDHNSRLVPIRPAAEAVVVHCVYDLCGESLPINRVDQSSLSGVIALRPVRRLLMVDRLLNS